MTPVIYAFDVLMNRKLVITDYLKVNHGAIHLLRNARRHCLPLLLSHGHTNATQDHCHTLATQAQFS